jgi:hypothetical protein
MQSIVGTILFYFFGLTNSIDFSRKEIAYWFPVSILLVATVYTGSKSLASLSVFLFSLFKNINTILIALAEHRIFKLPLGTPMIFAFVLMIFSCIGGIYWDGISDYLIPKYFMVLLHSLTTTIYVITLRKSPLHVSIKNPLDVVFYNNLLSIPTLLLLSYYLEDWGKIYFYYSDKDNSNELFLLMYCLAGSAICNVAVAYFYGKCVQTIDGSWLALVNAWNKVPMAPSRVLLHPFTESNTYLILCTFMSFIGNLTYGCARSDYKYHEINNCLTLVPKGKIAEKESGLHLYNEVDNVSNQMIDFFVIDFEGLSQ